MAKVVPAESVSGGASRIIRAVWPTHGNNTEARRSENVASSPPPQPGGIRGNKEETDPKTEKALKDAGA